jgi:hypothetical protein
LFIQEYERREYEVKAQISHQYDLKIKELQHDINDLQEQVEFN